MKILVSGFEPFDGMTVNVSQEVVELLPATLGKAEIFKVILPVSFEKSFPVLKSAMDSVRPDAVIAFGLAVGRSDVTVERVALNIMDARTPDNDGFKPVDDWIVSGGDLALIASVPIKKMVAACKRAGVAASVSNSAGTYVCNQVMYLLLNAQGKESGADARGGFIHLPPKSAVELLPGIVEMLHEVVKS